MPVDFLESLLEALLRRPRHAAERAIEVLHGLHQVVMLASKELEALLKLAVLVIRHEVDGPHPFELGAKLLVADFPGLEVPRRIVGGEQRLRPVHGMAAAGLLEELLAPDAPFRLLQVQLVDPRDQAVQPPLRLTELVLRRLPLVEAPPVLLREHGDIPLLAVALRADFAGPLIGPALLPREVLPPVEDLGAAAPGLLETRPELDLELAQAVDLASERLDALENGGEIDTTGRHSDHDGRLASLVGLEALPQRRHLPLDVRLATRNLRQPPVQRLELARRRRRLARELAFLGLECFEMAQHALGLAAGGLDILLVAQPGRLLSVDGDLQNLLAPPQRSDLAVERMESPLGLLGLKSKPAQLLRELAQRPLPPEKRMVIGLPFVVSTAPRHRPAGRQHFAGPRDIRRHHPVAPPQGLGQVEVSDDSDARKQMPHQLGSRPADQLIRPGDVLVVAASFAGAACGSERLESEERRRARAFALEVGQRRARMLEALDDHPLEPVAEHRLQRRLETRRDIEQIRDGTHHAGDGRGRLRRKQRAHPGPVAFALTLEPAQRLAGRLLRGDRHSERRQRLLRVNTRGPLPDELLLDLLSLPRQQGELHTGLLEARLEAAARRG